MTWIAISVFFCRQWKISHVTGSYHVYCKNGNILETALHRDVVAAPTNINDIWPTVCNSTNCCDLERT